MAVESLQNHQGSSSELDFRSLVEQSVLGVIILQDHRIIFANQKIADLTGVNLEQLHQFSVEDIKRFFHPIAREQEFNDLLNFTVGNDLPARRELRIRHLSGVYFWVELMLSQIEYNSQPALQVTMIDITTRKQAEENLRYRLALEELVATLSSRFLYVSLVDLEKEMQRMLRLIGKFTCVDRSFVFLLSTDGAHISNVYDWHIEGIRPVYQRFVGKSVRSFKWVLDKLRRLQILHLTSLDELPESANIEIRFHRLLQTRSLLAIPLVMGETLIGWMGFATERYEKSWTDSDLKLLRLVGEMLTNVLLRKQMEEEVYQSEARYRAVVETQTEMILRWRSEGTVVFANQAFKRCFKIVGDSSDVQNILPFIHPDDVKMALQKLARLGPDLVEEVSEFRLVKPDGEIRWLHWDNRVILNQEGQLTEIQSVGRDITDLKLEEEELRQSYQKLAQTVHTLERHNREITLISEMGDLLQSCLRIEEANEVFAQFACQLFPDFSGVLYLFDVERNILEATATWGEHLQTDREFLARDCWAMRRGRPYVIENSDTILLCDHVNRVDPHSLYPYQCVPMMAQGETFGMLYLENLSHDNVEILLNQCPLAVMVAERMGMALSNLKLRETLKNQVTRDNLQ